MSTNGKKTRWLIKRARRGEAIDWAAEGAVLRRLMDAGPERLLDRMAVDIAATLGRDEFDRAFRALMDANEPTRVGVRGDQVQPGWRPAHCVTVQRVIKSGIDDFAHLLGARSGPSLPSLDHRINARGRL